MNHDLLPAGIRRHAAHVGLAVTSLLCIVLALDVRALRPKAAELQRRKMYPYIGQWLPTVRAATIAGDSVTVGETSPGRSQVLIFFSAKCPLCQQSVPEWKRIANALASDSLHRVDVYWVTLSSLDSTRVFIRKYGITEPVVQMPSWKINRVARVKGVPMTLVLDHYGRVVHVHPSTFKGPLEADSVVMRALSTDLPDTNPVSG